MIKYIVKRILYLIPILIGVTFLTFLMLYLAPSDPISMKYTSMATVGDSKYIEEKNIFLNYHPLLLLVQKLYHLLYKFCCYT